MKEKLQNKKDLSKFLKGSETKTSAESAAKSQAREVAPSVEGFEGPNVVAERVKTSVHVPTSFPSKHRQQRKDSVKNFEPTGKLLTDRFVDLQKKYTEIVVNFQADHKREVLVDFSSVYASTTLLANNQPTVFPEPRRRMRQFLPIEAARVHGQFKNSVQLSDNMGYANGIKGTVMKGDQLLEKIDGMEANHLLGGL